MSALTLDGAPWLPKLNGTAVDIDRGDHTFTFEVKGYAPVRQRFVIHEGEKGRHEVITMSPDSAPPPAPPPVVAPPAATAPPPPVVEPRSTTAPPTAEAADANSTSGRSTGAALTILGVTLGAVGAGFLAAAAVQQGSINDGGLATVADIASASSLGRMFNIVAIASLVGGAVSLAVGLLLFLASGPSGKDGRATGSARIAGAGQTVLAW